MRMLRSVSLGGLLLAAGTVLAVGTGPTQPQPPQPPLEQPAAGEPPTQHGRPEPGMPGSEGSDRPPRESQEQRRDREQSVPVEPEAQRDR